VALDFHTHLTISEGQQDMSLENATMHLL